MSALTLVLLGVLILVLAGAAFIVIDGLTHPPDGHTDEEDAALAADTILPGTVSVNEIRANVLEHADLEASSVTTADIVANSVSHSTIKKGTI